MKNLNINLYFTVINNHFNKYLKYNLGAVQKNKKEYYAYSLGCKRIFTHLNQTPDYIFNQKVKD